MHKSLFFYIIYQILNYQIGEQMLSQIKYFISGVIVTLSTIFIFNLEANNMVEEIPQSTFNIENINYNFQDIDWNNMFASEQKFTESKINSLKLKMKQCEKFENFVNQYINHDQNINLYELHLFDNYYEDNC